MQNEKILLTEETHMYTIGQVSEMFSLPISTLRYYDKEGLFPQMERSSGIRRFSERELEALRVIECLKRSGLEIKEIKQFMQWCAEGSGTYPQRHALFEHQLETVKALEDTPITNQSRYRVRSLPAAGALLREEDSEERQMDLLD